MTTIFTPCVYRTAGAHVLGLQAWAIEEDVLGCIDAPMCIPCGSHEAYLGIQGCTIIMAGHQRGGEHGMG